MGPLSTVRSLGRRIPSRYDDGMETLEGRLKARARGLGFVLAGLAPAAEADGFDRLHAWLAEGRHGDMDYLRRLSEERRHPRSILDGVRSVLMVAMCHDPDPPCGAPRAGETDTGGVRGR